MALAFARLLLLLWIGLAASATMLTNIDPTIQPTVQISVEDEDGDEEYGFEGFEEEEDEDEEISGKDMALEAVGKVETKCSKQQMRKNGVCKDKIQTKCKKNKSQNMILDQCSSNSSWVAEFSINLRSILVIWNRKRSFSTNVV